VVSTLIKSVADFRERHKLVYSSSTLVTLVVIAKSEIATPSARNDIGRYVIARSVSDVAISVGRH
jgi:hypothetical protein